MVWAVDTGAWALGGGSVVTAFAAIVGAILAYRQKRVETSDDHTIQLVNTGVKSLEAALRRADADVAALRSRLDLAHTELDELRAQLSEVQSSYKAQLDEAQRQIAALNIRVTDLSRENRQLKDRVAELEATNGRH